MKQKREREREEIKRQTEDGFKKTEREMRRDGERSFVFFLKNGCYCSWLVPLIIFFLSFVSFDAGHGRRACHAQTAHRTASRALAKQLSSSSFASLLFVFFSLVCSSPQPSASEPVSIPLPLRLDLCTVLSILLERIWNLIVMCFF